MSAVLDQLDPQNLTGKVIVNDPRPKFNGNYSYVYQGNVGDKRVAVKVIKGAGDPRSVRRKVLRERTIWASLSHQNILPFYGFADDLLFGIFEAPFGALISPWYDNGDAGKFLDARGKFMSLGERIELWQGVIDGVVYLHHHDPVIVHGDLKPGNVLIDESGQPRLCDFGLARLFLDQAGSGLTTTTEHTGTERYLAPELVQSEGIYPNTATDVWALGCLGLEFMHLQRPYANRKNNLRGIIISDLKRGIPPANGPPQPSCRFWDVCSPCWNAKPEERPSASATAHALRRRTMTFPLQIIEGIVSFATKEEDAEMEDGWGVIETDRDIWRRRNEFLTKLCLLSKAFHSAAMAALYRHIRIYVDSGLKSLNMLVDSLRTSSRGAKSSTGSHKGYTLSLVLIVGPLSKWGVTLADGILYESAVNIFKGFSRAIGLMCSLQSAMIAERNFSPTLLPIFHTGGCTTPPSPKSPTLGSSTMGDALNSGILTACQQLDTESLQFYPSQKLLLLGRYSASFLIGLIQYLPQILEITRLFAIFPWSFHLYTPVRGALSFPSLQQLVALDGQGVAPTGKVHSAAETLLAAASNWYLPNLTYLHIKTMELSATASSLLCSFLRRRGATLQHLTLDIHPVVEAFIPKMSEILPLCPHIRSLHFPMQGNVGAAPLYRHSKLEILNLTWMKSTQPHASLKGLKEFRRAALGLYPRLKNAKLIFRLVPSEKECYVTFRGADRLIHFRNGETNTVVMVDEVEDMRHRFREVIWDDEEEK